MVCRLILTRSSKMYCVIVISVQCMKVIVDRENCFPCINPNVCSNENISTGAGVLADDNARGGKVVRQ
jgi:hypothetical protein